MIHRVVAQRRGISGVESAPIWGLSWAEVDEKVEAFGATRYVSAQGEIFQKLEGEWCYIGQERLTKKKKFSQKPGAKEERT